MIPVELKIKNFMSYGDNVPPLDFRPFHVACLWGNNGHGKSALIDAITWSLWGEGRKTSQEKKASDGLLKIGTTEMMVELIFDLEGDRFRVIRQYSKSGNKTKTDLEFEVFNQEKNEFMTMTQKSITQTQEKINQFLKINYESFINSSVLLQGRADEFATKKAGERKQLIADILGLSKYDILSDKAKEKYKEASIRLTILEEEIINLEEELIQKKNVLERLNKIKDSLKELNSEIEDIEKSLINKRDEKSRLIFLKEHLKAGDEQIERDEKNLKEMEIQKTQTEEELERLRQIIKEEKTIQDSYHEYEEYLKQDARMFENSQKTTGLKQKKNSLESKLGQTKNELLLEIKGIKEKVKSIKEQIDTGENIIREKEKIEENYKKLNSLEEKELKLEISFKKQTELEEKVRELEKVINQKENTIKIKTETFKNQIDNLNQKKLKMEKIYEELKSLKKKEEKLEILKKEKEEIIKDGLDKKAKIKFIKEQIAILEKTIDEDRDKWKRVSKTTEGRCPLCDAFLDKEKKKKTLEKIQKEGAEKKEELKKNLNELEKTEKKRNELIGELKKVEEEIAKEQHLISLIAQKDLELEEAKKAEEEIKKIMENIEDLEKVLKDKNYAGEEYEELKSLEKNIIELNYNIKDREDIKKEKEKLINYRNLKIKLDITLEAREKFSKELPLLEKERENKSIILEGEDFSHDLRDELKQISMELDNLNYSSEEHNKIREKIKKLSKVTTQYILLENAKKQLPLLEKKNEEMKEKIISLEKLIKNLNDEKEEKAGLIKDLPALEEEIPQMEIQLQGLRIRINDLTSEKGNLENISKGYKKLEETLKKLKKEKEEKTKDTKIYKILAKAFGRDGIQALIIQNSIPEIEGEANALLSRLTDNRIQVSLELERSKKSGGTKDTLDIKISDEIGIRDYELYSGGEAFRTNFALRVALAKLLARRAGTKLRTLIIDEGFGTQDSQGLEQLVEVIQEISSDFDKIIVITHLENLKSIFPTTIEVIKTSTHGSVLRIIHN